MTKGETAKYTSEYGNIHGDKLYEQRARLILPILIRQAKAEQTITYGRLADEIGMPNPRNLNYPLGTVGGALATLSAQWGEEIPSIQAVVVNDGTGIPGIGISYFIEHPEAYKKSRPKHQKAIVNDLLRHIYQYPKWDHVLESFDLKPANPTPILETTDELPPKYPHGSGESDAHIKLKDYIANHPEVIGLSGKLAPGIQEFRFRSADSIDVLFKTETRVYGVEVKSHISDEQDLERGLYQCVKYHALLEANEKINQQQRDVFVVLCVGKSFPSSLYGVQNTLGIEVKDKITI